MGTACPCTTATAAPTVPPSPSTATQAQPSPRDCPKKRRPPFGINRNSQSVDSRGSRPSSVLCKRMRRSGLRQILLNHVIQYGSIQFGSFAVKGPRPPNLSDACGAEAGCRRSIHKNRSARVDIANPFPCARLWCTKLIHPIGIIVIRPKLGQTTHVLSVSSESTPLNSNPCSAHRISFEKWTIPRLFFFPGQKTGDTAQYRTHRASNMNLW